MMNDRGVSDALAVLLAADPNVIDDRDDLAGLVREARKLRGWIDAVDVRLARRGRELAEAGKSESAGSMLTEEGRRSGKEARATETREKICSDLPGFEDALATGDVSADHLDVLGKATKGLDQAELSEFHSMADDLLNDAKNNYVSGFERNCRNLADRIREMNRSAQDAAEELDRQRRESKVSRWTDKTTGMHKTLIELDPVRDETLWTAIDAQLARLKQDPANAKVPYAQLQIEALLAAVSAGEAGLRVPEVSIMIDHQTITTGRHEQSVCETRDGAPLPVETVRRMACDCGVIPIVLSSDGVPIDVGRRARTATKEQRDALAAMYQTCAHPECQVPFSQCRIHHIKHWADDGPTDLDNLIPLCEIAGHHHQVHEGGWNITMTPTRETTWIRPDSTPWTTNHPDRQPQPT